MGSTYSGGDFGDLPNSAAQEYPDQANDLKELHKDLHAMSIHDLTALSFMDKPCAEMNCRAIKNEKASKIIAGVITQKQTEGSLSSGSQQGWSAVGSLIVSVISLLISITTFIRQQSSSRSQPRRPVQE